VAASPPLSDLSFYGCCPYTVAAVVIATSVDAARIAAANIAIILAFTMLLLIIGFIFVFLSLSLSYFCSKSRIVLFILFRT
jgi:hypothetical protein